MSKIKLPHASGNSMSIAAPATNPASDLELKLPATIGSANQLLKNSSTAGTLEFSSLVEDSSGNVGIGTSSPGQLLSLKNTSAQCQQSLTAATNGSCAIYFGDTDSVNRSVILHHNTGDYLAFSTAGTERMRIPDATWGLLVTNAGSTGNTGGYQTDGASLRYSADSTFCCDGGAAVTFTRKSSAGKVIDFYSNTNYAGGVYVNGANSADYQSSSDYRLKDNVSTMSDGITKIKQLNPIYYTNKQIGGITDTTTVYTGFLAHEVKAVIPTLVDGEKDAPIDDKGQGYQTLSYGRFSPTVVAAMKELIAKVETLEAEVAALKSS